MTGKKASWTILPILALLLSGCGIERKVDNNVFSSSLSPKTRIRIDQSYTYLGPKQSNYIGSYHEDTLLGPPQVDKDKFEFRKITDGTRSLIRIEIKKLYTFAPNVRVYLHAVKSGRPNHTVREGYLDDIDMYYFIYPYRGEYKEIQSSCVMIKYLGKNIGDTVRFSVKYYEDLSSFPDASLSCSDWDNPATYTEQQKQFLDGFMARSEKNITFLDF